MTDNLTEGGGYIKVYLPDEIGELRPDLQRAFDAMVFKLRRNKHKGKWVNLNLDDSFTRLQEEIEELREAMNHGNTMEIVMESADCMNFLLILSSIALEAKHG